MNKNVLIFLLVKVNPTFWTVAKTVLTLDSVKNIVDDVDADIYPSQLNMFIATFYFYAAIILDR